MSGRLKNSGSLREGVQGRLGRLPGSQPSRQPYQSARAARWRGARDAATPCGAHQRQHVSTPVRSRRPCPSFGVRVSVPLFHLARTLLPSVLFTSLAPASRSGRRVSSLPPFRPPPRPRPGLASAALSPRCPDWAEPVARWGHTCVAPCLSGCGLRHLAPATCHGRPSAAGFGVACERAGDENGVPFWSTSKHVSHAQNDFNAASSTPSSPPPCSTSPPKNLLRLLRQ